jgi:hypothetical protein
VSTVSPWKSTTADRRPAIAAAVAAAALFVPLCVPLARGHLFAIGDLADFHLPMRQIYQSALVDGHSLLWSDRLFGGFYFHAEGQVGVFHPLHLLLYWLFPLVTAFNLELIASYVFGFAGMWLLLRRHAFSPVAAITGAMAFAFSGFNLLHLLHMNAVAVLAHMPWLLLSLDAALRDDGVQRRLGLAGIALLAASTILLGYPQYVLIAALACGAWLACNLHRASAWNVAWIALAGLAGLMLGGIQLLPTLDLLATSVRQAVTPEFALSLSLHPLNLVQLLSPYALPDRVHSIPEEPYTHEFGVYNGALCTIAIVWVLARWRELPSRRLCAFAIMLVAAGVVFALGRYAGVYDLLVGLPLVGSFRAPARYIALVHFGLAILAAILVEDLRRIGPRPPRRMLPWVWLPVVISLAALAFAWYWIEQRPGVTDRALDPWGIVQGFLLLTAAAAIVSIAARGSSWSVALLPLLLAFDLGFWGYSYVWEGRILPLSEIAARSPLPPASAGARVHDGRDGPWPNALLLNGFTVMRPYVGLAPERRMSLTSPEELRVAGIEWVRSEAGWAPVTAPMPRVRILGEAVVLPDPADALAGIDILRTATVAQPVDRLSSAGSVTLAGDTPGRIVVDVISPGRSLLVTTEAWHAGWVAVRRDGRELSVVRVYGDQLGVLLEPGQARVVLRFEPSSFRSGVYVSIAGALLLAAVLLGGWGEVRRLAR